MTEQEAIAIIKKNYPKCCKMVNGRYEGGFDDTDCELGQAFNIAIKALEEVQQYRAIGTPEECRAAVEKQTAKKIEIFNGQASCPNCKYLFGEMDIIKNLRAWNMPHCKDCGQKLDWSDEE